MLIPGTNLAGYFIKELDPVANPTTELPGALFEVETPTGPNGDYENKKLTSEQLVDYLGISGAATALASFVTLDQAQALLTTAAPNGVQPGVLYAIKGQPSGDSWNQSGDTETVYVEGLDGIFSSLGQVDRQTVTVDVAAGTYQPFSGGGGGAGSPALYADFSFTAGADGAQSFSLPSNTQGIDGPLQVQQADNGAVRTIGSWSLSGTTLTIDAKAKLLAGDYVFGRRYYGGAPGAGGYTDQQAINANAQPIADAKQEAIDEALTLAAQQLKVPIDTGLFVFNSNTGLYDQLDVEKLATALTNNTNALATLKAAIGSTGNGGGGGGGTAPTVTRFSSIANNDGANPITYFPAASPVPAYFQGKAGVAADSGGNAGLLDLKLAANTDGYVEFQYYATDGIYGHLGFNTDGSTAQARNLLEAGIYIENGNIGTIDNGVLTLSSTAISLGSRLRLGRVGSAYKVYVVSADRATVTDFLTLAYTGTAEMFSGLSISDNKKVYDALGGNLIPR